MQVVVERHPEDGRGALLGKLNAADLHLVLLKAVSVGHSGRAKAVRRAMACLCVSGEGAVSKPRPGQPISIVVFVSAVCDVHICVP